MARGPTVNLPLRTKISQMHRSKLRHRVCFSTGAAPRGYWRALKLIMARLEGNKPNTGAILIGAIIFSLVAAGLFFAFKNPAQPDENAPQNAVSTSAPESAPDAADNTSADATSDPNASGDSSNSLSTILTPIPTATVAPPSTDNSAPANAATANTVTTNAATSAH